MKNSYVYLNGQVLPASQAAVSAFDHGLLYGHGLFETLPVYNRQVFRLNLHLERLYRGAMLLGWPPLPSESAFSAIINEVLAANQLADGAVRLSLFRGAGPLTPDDSSCGAPAIFVAPRPFSRPTDDRYRQGWKLSVVDVKRNETSPLCGIKTTNYLDNILAKRAACSTGANESLLMNTKGFIAEGSSSNIFFVTGDTLVTPDLSSGILPGVVRAVVLELAQSEGLTTIERPIALQELSAFSEVFITNSLIEVMPVTAIDGHNINSAIGSLTEYLQRKYREIVERETSS